MYMYVSGILYTLHYIVAFTDRHRRLSPVREPLSYLTYSTINFVRLSNKSKPARCAGTDTVVSARGISHTRIIA